MAFPPDISVDRRDLDCDEFVYHYTSSETALNHVLTGGSIRLGLLRNTNDPRENRTWSFGISGTNPPDPPESNPERQEWIEKTWKAIERAPAIIQEKCKLLCVTMDDPSYSAFADGMMAFALRQEDIDHHGLENCLVTQRERYHGTFFFSKALDWQQEFEYRWIAIGGPNEPEFVPIKNAIAGVVVGVGFPDDALPHLLTLCGELEIPAARIGWENGIPRLNHRYM